MATLLTGKVNSGRKPGRPFITYIDTITKKCDMKLQKITHGSQERKEWARTVMLEAAANIDNDDADRRQVNGLGKMRVNFFPKAIATWHGREPNPRPPDLESDALPILPRCPFYLKGFRK
ncbi:hypothetical protein ElyMa_004121600 [Elysia marginata]|uniref:Uncharacterized protein n=1 Tax=Elysia marginata TaxID=1093978 RepID=A0AAV4GCG5_9GAST|nr:hypothetical protein ElyMa_004121600 [Elysia marginata]